MEIEELALLKVYADGRTSPVVPSGTEIVLIQDGTLSIGKIVFGSDDDDHPVSIDHPVNENDLLKKAKELVIKKDPSLLKNKDAIILICPIELKSQLIWDSIK